MQQNVDLIAHCVKARGPNQIHYANLTAAFKRVVGHVHPQFIEWMVREIQSDQIGHYPFYGLIPHIYFRPYRCMGDFELLAKFYDAYDKYHLGLRSKYDLTASDWDAYVLSLPCSQSLFNREAYLLKRIGQCIEKTGALSVLDIACGNGRLMKKLLEKYPHIQVVGIDSEPMAIEEAKKNTGRREYYEVVNALKDLPDCDADIVVSAGLFDYLPEVLGTRLLQRVQRHYDPDMIIVGNLTNHDSEPLMELLGWDLHYRNRIELSNLVINGIWPKDVHYNCRVEHEPLEINLFLVMEK